MQPIRMPKFTLTNNFMGSCPGPMPEFCGFFRIDFMTLILRRLSPGISELRLTGKIFGLKKSAFPKLSGRVYKLLGHHP